MRLFVGLSVRCEPTVFEFERGCEVSGTKAGTRVRVVVHVRRLGEQTICSTVRREYEVLCDDSRGGVKACARCCAKSRGCATSAGVCER